MQLIGIPELCAKCTDSNGRYIISIPPVETVMMAFRLFQSPTRNYHQSAVKQVKTRSHARIALKSGSVKIRQMYLFSHLEAGQGKDKWEH